MGGIRGYKKEILDHFLSKNGGRVLKLYQKYMFNRVIFSIYCGGI